VSSEMLFFQRRAFHSMSHEYTNALGNVKYT
jgi:hypothetical protein